MRPCSKPLRGSSLRSARTLAFFKTDSAEDTWTEKTMQRFTSKISPPNENGCMLWNASIRENGYGQFHLKGKVVKAHRYAYELAYGKIEDDRLVCHRCDVRACVNPDHLFLGTNAENTADMIAKQRSGNGRRKLTESQVREIRSSTETQRQLAERFQISIQHVYYIRRGTRWIHLGEGM